MEKYDKYINSSKTHYISNSGSDENKKYNSGKAGDQTNKEWELRTWYSRPWTHVIRYEKNPRVGEKLAALGCAAALNNAIGYDQYQRLTYWNELKKVKYDPSKINTKCESDCSAGVAAHVKATGYLLNIKELQNINENSTTRNILSQLRAAGFTIYTSTSYKNSTKYLLPGDLLLYENHHIATNITKGTKAIYTPITKKEDLKIIDTAIANQNMYVRAEPKTSGRSLGIITKGTKVEIVEKTANNWYKIIYSNNIGYGYTSNSNGKYYTLAGETNGAQDVSYITTGAVNVREGAGINSKKILVLPKDYTVKYNGKYENILGVDWLFTAFTYKNQDIEGYISSKYLKKVN